MKERIEEIFAKMDEFRKESTDHATKGNKLAGRRARVASLEIAKMLKEYRWVSVEWDKGNSAKAEEMRRKAAEEMQRQCRNLLAGVEWDKGNK